MAPPSEECTSRRTMKAGVATGFGSIFENIFLCEDWPMPRSDEIPEGYLLIKVLACALAPGDPRILSGDTDFVQLPKEGHPYVIGSDNCGKVVAINKREAKFAIGDYVVSRFALPGPVGGCAEFRLVETKLTEHCPKQIPPNVACGLSASAVAAKKVVNEFVKDGDRVLVIGGSSGVGTSVLQYCRPRASYIAAVSTQIDLCSKLGADAVVDYRSANWWELSDFKEKKFDCVIDLVNGDNWTIGGCAGTAVKRRGTYVGLMSGVATTLHVHGVWDLVRLSWEWLFTSIWSRLNPKVPKWVMADGLNLEEGDIASVLEDVVNGKLKPVLDPASPFDFTQDGIRKAMQLQRSAHAHGKVVIEIAQD